jgi:hypothetical protein
MSSILKVGDGKCWSHDGKYMGKLKSFNLIGRVYDPDPEYTFEKGIVSGLGLKFTEVQCEVPKSHHLLAEGSKRKVSPTFHEH